jgi:MFS family permease
MTAIRTPAARASLGADYRRLWSSSAASNLADGIFTVALPLVAVRLTDSPAAVAGVAFAGRLPWLAFVLFAGALADRLDRRITMRNVQVLRVAVVGVLAALALTGQLDLIALYVAAFVLGIGETLFDTAAQSILPMIVPRELVSRANGRLYAVETLMNSFVGPPLGGFLVAISVPLALAGSATGFALAAVGLVLLRGSFRPHREGPPTSIVRDVAEGLGDLWSQPVIRSLAIMVGILNLASSAVMAVIVLFAVAPGPMGLDEVSFGLLMTGFAIGALVGSLVVERVEALLGRSRALFLSILLMGVASLVPALTTGALLVAAALVLEGTMTMVWNVITVSLRQRIAPEAMLGRVNAGYRLFAWGTMPIGALVGGVVAEALGFAAVFVMASAATFALLAFRPLLTDARIAAAEAPLVAGPQAAVT